MKLYSFSFPNKDICAENEMYYKTINCSYNSDSISCVKNSVISTFTYFNSFSAAKWLKYTKISNLIITLRLKGDFNIDVCCDTANINKENASTTIIKSSAFSNGTEGLIDINCEIPNKEILYVKLTALSDGSAFYGGVYSTNIDESQINYIKLALGICTFQREMYVEANLKRLSIAIANPNSPLFSNVKVFVSDNGQTLDIDKLNSEIVYIVNNKNLGGAGGFTRCMIEASNANSSNNFTNFIFMDDDIILDVNAVERNYVFLQLLKPEHQQSVIGGAMFSTDDTYLQFENAAKWHRTGFIFNRRDVDLRNKQNIILNEKEYDVNYNAWCYCCIPFNLISNTNLPIPIFFHMDDVEYGLRNGLPIITLNGINVWHLYKKSLVNAKNDYYDVRNRLIMLSEISPDLVYELAVIYLSVFSIEALKYHYARSINALNGILDFCKGFDYFKNLDTLKKHNSLYNNVKWIDSTADNRQDAIFSMPDKRTRKFKISNAIKIILPSKKSSLTIYNENSISDASKSRKIIVYNRKEEKSIIYKKNRLLALRCLILRKQVKNKLKGIYKVAIEFNQRISEIQNLDFWNNYLELPARSFDKKVLFCASDNDVTSGAFRSMVSLNGILNKDFGVDTTVLLSKNGDGTNLLRAENIKHTTIQSEDWIILSGSSKRSVKSKKKAINNINKKAYKQIQKLIIEQGINLVHINTSYHYVAAKAATDLGIPVVWHIREFLEEDQSREIFDKKFGYRYMQENATKFIAISNSIADKYKSLFGDKVKTIYNGIDENIYLNNNRKLFTTEKTVFMIVGVVRESKGQQYLFDACKIIYTKGYTNFELWIVGNDKTELGKKLKSEIANTALESKIKFFGRQNDVSELYKQADIVFVCAEAEAFGRTTIEAMLSGCLVIGSNAGGTKELIQNNITGLLFTPKESEDLANKIEYALINKKQMKSIARSGRSFALKNYTAKINAQHIYDLYNNILGD